eukprot:8514231-Pyramimonas_sp.AAC.1
MLQLALLQPLDAVASEFRIVHLGVVVEDFGLHAYGRESHVLANITRATQRLHHELECVDLRIKQSKSRVVASSPDPLARIQTRL